LKNRKDKKMSSKEFDNESKWFIIFYY
jgi:hypothetical protein